jgi:CheY-like chemotaxis protein
MGGTISVESAPGKGARFWVELPAEPAEESEVTHTETEEERTVGVAVDRPDYRVLIVEDGEENRLVLRRLMQNSGFQVRLAEDGRQGVEAFQTWRPHLIWMDLRMPVMDGKEAARRIRALDGGREVKIVAVTASAFLSERDEVLAAGVDDFIRKPYHPGEIFACMVRHLGLRPIYRNASQEERAVLLSRQDLETLPPELVRELADAVVTLEDKRIREVIARISDCDAAIGHKLAYFADRFAYTPILNAVRTT